MAPKDDSDGQRGPSRADREALREALAGVKPLGKKAAQRVARSAEVNPSPTPRARAAGHESLQVERESNGIVTGKRAGAHRSILDALEDPKLEVEAECDLHGLTAREAEREVQRFIRHCQQSGKRWVLIIAGKGLHSPRGKGTLADRVVQWLSRGAPARFVEAFQTAPRRLGGQGAFVVRLR